MNKSNTIAELAKALVAVQSELLPADKDAANPFFKSNYASLNSIWNSCKFLLAKNGLAISQLNQLCDTGVIIETVLMHTSGEWISGEIMLPLVKHDAQGVGSAATYGRRYGLAAILGIVADVDDDGNAAALQHAPARPEPRSQDFQTGSGKPANGQAANLNDAATTAQIALLKSKLRGAGSDVESYIAEHFPDVTGADNLSKRAASYLISQLGA